MNIIQNPGLAMSNIDELANEFYIYQELYEKEQDPKVKEVLVKRLLELARAVGNMIVKEQTY